MKEPVALVIPCRVWVRIEYAPSCTDDDRRMRRARLSSNMDRFNSRGMK